MARPTRVEFTRRILILVDELREQIQSGQLQPNEFLPSELSLGERYELSKESVRRALDELVSEGLITKVRRVGNKVNDPSMWAANYDSKLYGDAPASANSMRERKGSNRTILRFAYYGSLLMETPLQQLVDNFEMAHPGVQIQLMPTYFPMEYADRGLADVVTIAAWDAMKCWNRPNGPGLGHLTSSAYTAAAHPKLVDPFRDPYSPQRQRLVATPFLFSPLILCYNRAHFLACGLSEPDTSWTWYTLLNAARQITRRLDVWGFATHIQSINRWPVFLLQNEFSFQTRERDEHIADDPALWESLRIARDLVHKQGRAMSLWTEDNSDAEQMFLEGNASMILTTYYGLNSLRGSNLDYALAPLPSLSNANTLLLVTGLSVHRNSPHQQLARLFVDYLSSFEAQASIRRQTLSLPAHKDALAITDGLLGNRPYKEDVYKSMWTNCRQFADLGLDANTIGAIRNELKAYWARMEDEAEASMRLETLLREARPMNAL